MRWLTKRREAILRAWRSNEISLSDAAVQLAALGVIDPWAILASA